MHELSLALSLLDLAAAEAQRRGGAKVRAVHVRLGPLAGVVKEALVSAYELARRQTPLAEARLVVEEVPLLLYCGACRARRAAESASSLRCACCGALSGELLSGRELELAALEIEA